ncbi:MAG TPA: cytochrome c [Bacteroidota bacterium]|nr:cytochrome c [Bacteroidota bacterium]
MDMTPKDEMDFSDLLKDPKRLFGLTYIYFLVIGVLIGGYFVVNFNVMTRNVIMPVVSIDSASAATDIPMVRSSVIPPVDVTKAAIPTKEAIARGAALFKANCVSCHGDNGMGDGPTAATLDPKPRNFHVAQGWKNGRKISQMYKTLQEGIPKSGMASYNYMPADDRFALIHYVRTFAPDFPVDSSADLAELEKTYQLSKGSVTPAQIPVRVAIEKIASEHRQQIAAASETFTAALKSESRGAQILRRIILNPRRAAMGIASLQGKAADDALRAIAVDPAAFGLKASAALLTADEWNAVMDTVHQ